MSWDFAPADKAFEKVRNLWDQLNAACGNHILLDSIFVECALRHFSDGSVLLGVKSDSRKPALGLFAKKGVGLWETFQPSQAPLGLILLPKQSNAHEEIPELMRALPGYALQLSMMQQDPGYPTIPPTPEGEQFECVDYIETARISLVGTFEEYWRARGIKLRQNVGRRKRRIEETGFALEHVALRKTEEMAGAVKEYGRLESKGWKAQAGTAVSLDNAQGRFYREMFERFCERGEAVVYQYRANGEVLATDLCLIRSDMLVLLKTTYDEEWNKYSPAILMREHIMSQLYAERSVRQLEFYGRAMDWHRQWTDDIRTMYHVNCYRQPWIRRLKAFIKRVRSKRSEQAKSVDLPQANEVGGAEAMTHGEAGNTN